MDKKASNKNIDKTDKTDKSKTTPKKEPKKGEVTSLPKLFSG